MEFAKCFYLKTDKFWHFRREIEQLHFLHLIKKQFLSKHIKSFHRFQFLWDKKQNMQVFLLREVSEVGPRCFWNAQKWRSTEKLAKLTVYLSLEFPLVPEPAVQLMLMLTECNHFFCVSARLGCVKYSLERAFCTVSFPFIFLAFQALSPLWPIYPLNYMIFLSFISSLYWLVTASCQQSDNPSNELIMNTMLYSWNAYVAGN